MTRCGPPPLRPRPPVVVLASIPSSSLLSAARATRTRAAARDAAARELASGYRIERAAHGAAELAVGTRFDVDRRSLDVAEASALRLRDEIEGADASLAGAAASLRRALELATKAATDGWSPGQRDAIAIEFSEMLAAYEDAVTTTASIGRRLLVTARVDIGLVVDATGSMGSEIEQLANAIGGFEATLLERGFSVQLGLAAIGSNLDTGDGVARNEDLGAEDIAGSVRGIGLAGGRVDAWNALLETSGATDQPGSSGDDAFSWRDDAFRRLIVMTDADREEDFIPGDETASDIVRQLRDAGVTVDAVGNARALDTLRAIAVGTGGQTAEMDRDGVGVAEGLSRFLDQFAPDADSSPLQALFGTRADQIYSSNVPVDTTPGAVGIRGLSVATREDAAAAVEGLQGALEAVSGARAALGTTVRTLERGADFLGRRSETLEGARARLVETDVADAHSRFTAASVGVDVAHEVLRRGATTMADSYRSLYASASARRYTAASTN